MKVVSINNFNMNDLFFFRNMKNVFIIFSRKSLFTIIKSHYTNNAGVVKIIHNLNKFFFEIYSLCQKKNLILDLNLDTLLDFFLNEESTIYKISFF